MVKPSKPKGGYITKHAPKGVKPGDYLHLKRVEKEFEPTVNYDTRELGNNYSLDGQELYTTKQQRIDQDARIATQKGRTRAGKIVGILGRGMKL